MVGDGLYDTKRHDVQIPYIIIPQHNIVLKVGLITLNEKPDPHSG